MRAWYALLVDEALDPALGDIEPLRGLGSGDRHQSSSDDGIKRATIRPSPHERTNHAAMA
jgi:hypothetical protein